MERINIDNLPPVKPLEVVMASWDMLDERTGWSVHEETEMMVVRFRKTDWGSGRMVYAVLDDGDGHELEVPKDVLQNEGSVHIMNFTRIELPH
jgi:hypothetical protein